jgi:hypothetical protein
MVDVGKEDMSPVKNGFFYTVSGVPFSLYKYAKVISGSPYFKEDWMRGVAVLTNGGRAKCDQIKLDLFTGEVHYKDSTGPELIATNPIARLTLTDMITGIEYVFTNNPVSSGRHKGCNSWYQVLETGTATLYKRIKKTLTEATPFNSATAEQTINTASFYFIEISNDIIAVKKLKDIPAVLSDKKNELEEFITTKRLNGKADSDYVNVVARFNYLAVSN